MRHKIGIILSGCGFKDGSEIHESVLAILALSQQGQDLIFTAPERAQAQVVNHVSGQKTEESRNILIESARIARGNIEEISGIRAADLDALVLPGGFGAATNLSTFAQAGVNMEVEPKVQALIKAMFLAGKPIAAICIAPVILAKVLGEYGIEITIGDDLETSSTLEKMGVRHINCPPDRCVVDHKHKIVTTPAYMLGKNISDIYPGITQAMLELGKLIKA